MSRSAPSRLERYLTVILRWVLIIFAVFYTTLHAGQYIEDHLWLPVYRAKAVIELRSVKGLENGNDADSTLPGEINIIRSSDVLLPVIVDLGLEKSWAQRVYHAKEDYLSDQVALAYLNHVVKLDSSPGSNLIAVIASSDVPKEAADIANAIAERYKALRIQEEGGANRGSQTPIIVQTAPLLRNPVCIRSRAEIPTTPDHSEADFVARIIAGVLSLLAASFVEMVFLFLRASERIDN